MELERKESRKMNEYCSKGEAAKILGVSGLTLINWEKKGVLKTRRHPMNGFRIYVKSELLALLEQIENS